MNYFNFIPPKEQDPIFEELNKKLKEDIDKLLKERDIQIENFTKAQTCEAFRQAILSGDFVKLIIQDASRQGVVYIPCQRCMQLEVQLQNRDTEIIELKKLLDALEIKYVPLVNRINYNDL